MTQFSKTEETNISSSTPPGNQQTSSSTPPNVTDTPPNVTDTPPNVTDTPPNVTDTPTNVINDDTRQITTNTPVNVQETIQITQSIPPPPSYDQAILQPPNIQETSQNTHVNNQVIQPIQPIHQNFSQNIPSSYPYNSHYFSQPTTIFKTYNINPVQYGDNVIITNGYGNNQSSGGNNVINGNNAMSEYGNSNIASGYGNNIANGYGNNTTSGFTATGYQANSGYQPIVANGYQNDPATSNSYVINSVNSSGQNEYYVI
ncbi:974_t:CDS:2, partial [Gigaspora rosea]